MKEGEARSERFAEENSEKPATKARVPSLLVVTQFGVPFNGMSFSLVDLSTNLNIR